MVIIIKLPLVVHFWGRCSSIISPECNFLSDSFNSIALTLKGLSVVVSTLACIDTLQLYKKVFIRCVSFNAVISAFSACFAYQRVEDVENGDDFSGIGGVRCAGR